MERGLTVNSSMLEKKKNSVKTGWYLQQVDLLEEKATFNEP